MIAKLKGVLETTSLDSLIIDVNGVGYQVFCSGQTLEQCGQYGDCITLFIETHVREDHIHLYGFLDVLEQKWFKLLTSVQGVGVKAALAVLSVCSPDQLMTAIAAQDKAMVTRADGIGPKIAGRIVSELKDKVAAFEMPAGHATSGAANPSGMSASSASLPEGSGANHTDADVISALVNLGYGRSDAYSALLQVKSKYHNDNDENQDPSLLSVEHYIKMALKELSQ